MPVVLLWWQDSKVVNYVRLRKCRLVNSIRLDSYPVSQVSSSFRRYGELFPFLLGNHPEMSVFRCVCVCICREKEPFFFVNISSPQTFPTIKKCGVVCFFVWRWLVSNNLHRGRIAGDSEISSCSKFTTWCGWSDTHISLGSTNRVRMPPSAKCESFFVFCGY